MHLINAMAMNTARGIRNHFISGSLNVEISRITVEMKAIKITRVPTKDFAGKAESII
jgi:hypothetical protein